MADCNLYVARKFLAWLLLCTDRNNEDLSVRIPQTPRQPDAAPASESFAFKSILVASALFLAAFVMVELEFYISQPAHSLSEAEVTLRAAAR